MRRARSGRAPGNAPAAAAGVTAVGVGTTTVAATYGGVTSSPVTIRVEPAKVHLTCDQGLGFATGTVSNCTLRGATADGRDVQMLPKASWQLSSTSPLVYVYSDSTLKSVSAQLNADGPASITATYNDGTAGGLVDSPTWEVVNLTTLVLGADVTDVASLVYHDFAFSFTRPSGGALPTGFIPPWKVNYTDSSVLYGYVKSPTAVSIQGSWMGSTSAWVSYGGENSNKITLRSVPDHVEILATTAPVSVAAGSDVAALEIRPWVSSFQYTYLGTSAQVSVASANTAVATISYSITPGSGGTGAVAYATVHGVGSGTTTVTATVDGVTSAPLAVTVP